MMLLRPLIWTFSHRQYFPVLFFTAFVRNFRTQNVFLLLLLLSLPYLIKVRLSMLMLVPQLTLVFQIVVVRFHPILERSFSLSLSIW